MRGNKDPRHKARQSTAKGGAIADHALHILLVDEPLGALDAITAHRVRHDVIRLWQASGATVLYVTHNISEAVLLSDRVLVLYDRPTSVYRDVPIVVERPRDPADPQLLALESSITRDFFANVVGADREKEHTTWLSVGR